MSPSQQDLSKASGRYPDIIEQDDHLRVVAAVGLDNPHNGKGLHMGFKIEWEDGGEDDEVFATYEEAETHALEGIGNYHTGAEVLHLSNPGDYPEDDEDDDPEYEIVEVDD